MAQRIAQKAATQATRTSALAAAVRVPGFATAPKRAAKKASPHNDCTIELEISATSNGRRMTKRQFGRFVGKLRYMAEDFDEAPECFKEYV